jgi:hypothetical protein
MPDNINEIREGLEKQLKDGFAGLQKKYDSASSEIEKGNQVTTELKKQIQTATDEIQKVVDKVLKIEEKGVQLGNQPGQKKGFIDFIKDNGEYKALQGREKGSAEFEVKKEELAAMEVKAVTSAGIVVPNFDPTIQPGMRQELRIRDLIPSISVTGSCCTPAAPVRWPRAAPSRRATSPSSRRPTWSRSWPSGSRSPTKPWTMCRRCTATCSSCCAMTSSWKRKRRS